MWISFIYSETFIKWRISFGKFVKDIEKVTNHKPPSVFAKLICLKGTKYNMLTEEKDKKYSELTLK